jgi:hypothetical protein
MAGILEGRHKVAIDNNEYDILPHPATEGLSLAFKIGSLLDVIQGNASLFNEDEDGKKEVNPLVGMKLAGSICQKVIKDDPNMTLLLDLFKYTQVNGDTLNKKKFDDHFGGNYGELAEATMEVITANRFLEMVSLIG